MGYVELQIELGSGEHTRVRMLHFLVMNVESPPSPQCLSRMTRVAIALWYLTLKFPTDNGVMVVHDNQAAGRACHVAELRKARRKEIGKGVEKPLCIQTSNDGQLMLEPWLEHRSRFYSDIDLRGEE